MLYIVIWHGVCRHPSPIILVLLDENVISIFTKDSDLLIYSREVILGGRVIWICVHSPLRVLDRI